MIAILAATAFFIFFTIVALLVKMGRCNNPIKIVIVLDILTAIEFVLLSYLVYEIYIAVMT